MINEYNYAAAEGYFNEVARLLWSGTDQNVDTTTKCGHHYPSSSQFGILLSSGTDRNVDTTTLPHVNLAFHESILDENLSRALCGISDSDFRQVARTPETSQAYDQQQPASTPQTMASINHHILGKMIEVDMRLRIIYVESFADELSTFDSRP